LIPSFAVLTASVIATGRKFSCIFSAALLAIRDQVHVDLLRRADRGVTQQLLNSLVGHSSHLQDRRGGMAEIMKTNLRKLLCREGGSRLKHFACLLIEVPGDF